MRLVLVVVAALTGWAAAADASPRKIQRTAVKTIQTAFATPEGAVDALVSAARANDEKRLARLLGPGGERLIRSDNHVADVQSRRQFLALYDGKHNLAVAAEDEQILQVGNDDWPLPIPLRRTGARWHFDGAAGVDEIVDRRVGQNELAAIQALLALAEAEVEFFERAKTDAGVGQYALQVVSRPGTHDGLYWPADPASGVQESPLAGLVTQAQANGYPVDLLRVPPDEPYQGYYFKLLKGQGPDAPGGAKSYVADGKMTEGFAVAAWPADQGTSGVMSFLIDQDGVVFQKDFGAETTSVASTMALFDPDLTWARVNIDDR